MMSPLHEAAADRPFAGVAVPVTVDDHERCPATALLRRIGDKWSPVLLSLLAERSHGFNELDRSVEGLSRRMLVRTLRSLEREGLISRTLHDETPPRAEYALTDLGRSLRELLVTMAQWAVAHEAELLTARARYDAAHV
ncbi:helix-turn-helix transcriptional regulator [Streptomyces sp. LBUM 1483]|nr:helix-turn-helix transcriptional regulator [Streptomyces sp. LBUM 1481]MBP5919125.1 helix-turn-helix transcriptional regulator [Streptomyces sp. LBUM 1483]